MLRLLLATFILISFSNCKSINQRKDNATAQLNHLKNGALLVRLPTNEAKIKRLKELGKNEEAKKEAIFMEQFHQDILRAFDKNFEYSSVYFYYSDASKAVREGKYDEHLFDLKKNNVSSLSADKDGIFYAEFGKVHQNEVVSERDGKQVKVAGFGGRDALVIRTKEGVQPPRPFPYSVDYTSPFHLQLSSAIRKLDERLFIAYNKMERRKLRRQRRGK